MFSALTRIVGCPRYSQEQLYAVVAGVEHYKEFVPWCQRSHIIDRKPPGFVEAELEVGFKMFVERCGLPTSGIFTLILQIVAPGLGCSPDDVLGARGEMSSRSALPSCRYTSQVHLSPPGRVISRVYDSTLFDHLDSTWDFQPGPTPHSTWLSFTVDFAFKSPLYHHIATVFFDEVLLACLAMPLHVQCRCMGRACDNRFRDAVASQCKPVAATRQN